MELTVRLNIFKDSGMLSEENYHKVINVINYFDEVIKIKLDEENAAMFITHLCVALGRIDKNEIQSEIDIEILESLKLEENYNKSMEIVKDLKVILGELPIGEVNYLVMHICTLLEKVKVC